MLLRERVFGTGETFDYSRCGACGSVQIVRIPDDMARHYPPNYYAFSAPMTRKRRLALIASGAVYRMAGRRFLTRRLRTEHLLSVLPAPGARVLDIGSGSGWMLRELRHYGFDCYGVDPHIERSERVDGITLWKKDLSELAGETFDAVMMHHALEHVVDPHRLFEQVKPLLRPNAPFIVRVPIIPNNVWDEFGTDWPQLDAPRHIHTFSLRGLEILASKHGYVVKDVVFDAQPWSLVAARAYREGRALVDLTPDELSGSEADREATERANASGHGDQARLVFKVGR